MSTFDRLAEMSGADATEMRQAALLVGLFIASVIVALAILGAWVAAVLYVIVPLHLDAGAGVSLIRVVLAIGGGIVICVAYLFGLFAVTQ